MIISPANEIGSVCSEKNLQLQQSVLTGIELFGGAGGLAIGGAQAGLIHRMLVDKDSFSCKLLGLNQSCFDPNGHSVVLNEDITTISFKDFAYTTDIITGGPPCQPFSSGGNKKGQSDIRDMFPQAVRAVREIQPKAFIFENVAGLYQGRFNHYRDYVKLQLEHPSILRRFNETWSEHRERLREAHLSGDAEYRVIVKDDVNAADYGLPQNRQRILFIGIRSDLKCNPKMPRPTHSQASLQIQQWITNEYWERHEVPNYERPTPPKYISAELLKFEAGNTLPWQTIRDATQDLGAPKLTPDPFGHTLIPGARAYKGHDGSIIDTVSKALKAGVNGVPGGENCLRLADLSVRYFTLRECARLQGFPDNYLIPMGPWTPVMKALGNAVPVPVARTFIQSIVEALIKA